jgi:hypothetical protein
MPRRSNEFQKTIFVLQQQLAKYAKVGESKMLLNRDTGGEAEVDIVVEADAGGVQVVVGIECCATKRPATVEWVQHIYGKHRPLPVNKTVLVSKSGFTKTAIKQATAYKMDALTIKQAEERPWRDFLYDLTNLNLGSFSFRILGGSVHYNHPNKDLSALELSPGLLVFRGEPDDPITLSDLSNAIIADNRVGLDIMKHWLELSQVKRPAAFQFEINWRPGKLIFLGSDANAQYSLSQLNLRVEAKVLTAPISMEAGEYMGNLVAHGTAENIFEESSDKEREVIVTLLRQGEDRLKGAILVPKFHGGEDRIFDARFPAKREQSESTKNS